nr:MAG TPA: hypothetical protein [Ackermannviridae sp.]
MCKIVITLQRVFNSFASNVISFLHSIKTKLIRYFYYKYINLFKKYL